MGGRYVVVRSGVVDALKAFDSSRTDDFEDKLVNFYDGWGPKAAIKQAEGKRLWKVRQTAAALRGIGVWWGEYDEDEDFDSDVTDIFVCILLYDKDEEQEEFKSLVNQFAAEGELELEDINKTGPEEYLEYYRGRDDAEVLPPHTSYIGRK